MTAITTQATTLRPLGLVTLVTSLIGAACAALVIAWPPQVGEQWYSYPFDPTGYTVSQSFFAVHHLGMLAGLAGLLTLSRKGRAGLIIAMVGTLALTACELFAITAANAPVGSAEADAVDNAYGVPMILIGVGLVVAGVAIARERVLPGRQRWIPLALGVYVFVPLLPAVFGPMVLGRIAIGVWMLMFTALGVALMRAER